MLRVAVLGANGNAGRRHVAAFEAEGCEVIPVDIGDGPIPSVGIISIATPDNLHADAVVAGLASGRHVFCEKPLGHNREELQAIQDQIEFLDTTFSCNLPLRYNAELEHFLRGVHGFTYLMAEYRWGRRSKLETGWRGRIPDYSIVCGGGIHLVDVLMHATGQYPADIKAAGRDKYCVSATFWLGDMLVSLLVDFRHDDGNHRVILRNRGKSVNITEPADFRAPIHDFLEQIRRGGPGNGRDALAANRACLAIEEAARS